MALLAAAGAITLAGCGGGSQAQTTAHHAAASTTKSTTTHAAPPPPPPPPFARVLPGALQSSSSAFVPLARWDGHVVARIAHLGSGVVVMSFDQSHVRLRLHSGTTDAGPGYRFGPAVVGTERTHLLAGFNGGFRLSIGAGGFEANGHVAVPLRAGLGSVVTYSDGTTDVGSWHQEVPTPGKTVVSVRQNLQLLIDHGHPAGNIGCVQCWGATLGGVIDPARAALGVNAAGDLIWAAGEHLTVPTLAQALMQVHAVRAVELDINPEWVAGYVYVHHGHAQPVPLSVVAGQAGIPGEYLLPWSRDFFTVDVR